MPSSMEWHGEQRGRRDKQAGPALVTALFAVQHGRTSASVRLAADLPMHPPEAPGVPRARAG
jgi:hypothetical protein